MNNPQNRACGGHRTKVIRASLILAHLSGKNDVLRLGLLAQGTRLRCQSESSHTWTISLPMYEYPDLMHDTQYYFLLFLESWMLFLHLK
jgi:hypothetical protein